MTTKPSSEAQTRTELIDPALERAGWAPTDPTQVREETPVDDFPPQAWAGLKSGENGSSE